MVYMVTFTINIPQMLAYIPYMDPMGYDVLRSMCMVSSRVMVPPRNGAGCGCNVP